MKTLRKSLSFVLVLALVLGMVGSAFATTFTDETKITNTEAVKVLNAVKVIDGFTDGSFGPTNGLTRGQACAFVARLALGRTAADKLVAVEAPFKDVAANATFAGYIAWCKNQGYIDGYADKTFKSNNPLSTIAFAKMLLGVLGYKSEYEGFTGEGWGTRVQNVMAAAGLDADLVNGVAGNCTREDAAQLMLNALEANCVKYANEGTSIKVGGVEIVAGASKAEVLPQGTTYSEYCSPAKAGLQLAEKLFNATSAKLTKAAGTDDFKRPATVWTYVGTPTKTVKVADKPIVVYTSAKTAKEVLADIKGYAIASVTEIKTVDDAVANRAELNSSITEKNNLTGTLSNATKVCDNIADKTGNGRVVEIFATDKVINKIVVTGYTVAKVTDVTKNDDGDVTYAFGVTATDYADEDTEDTIVLAGSVAKNDYVTYTKDQNNVYYVYPTTKVVGQQTSAKSDYTIVVNGTTYKVATAVEGIDTSEFVNVTKDYNYFLDQFGFVVKTDAIAATKNYAYVDRIAKVNASTTGTADTDGYIEANLVLFDGTEVKGVKVATYAGIADTLNTAYASNTTFNQIVEYTINSKGKYELTFGKDVDLSTISTTKGLPAFGAKNADTKTVYLVKTADNDGAAVWTVYTGYAAAPSVSGAAARAVCNATTTSKVEYAFVNAVGKITKAETTSNIYYAASATKTMEGAGTDAVYSYEGYLNGAAYTFKTKKSDLEVTANDIYKLTIDEDGYVTAKADAAFTAVSATLEAADVTRAIEEGYLDTNLLVNDTDTTVYVVKDGKLTKGTVSSLFKGAYVYYEKYTTGSDVMKATVKTMYVCDKAAGNL